MNNLTILKVPVSDLKPSEFHSKVYSPRRVELLAESMHQYGQLEPIIINESNTILSGVLRWEAAN